MKDYVKENVSHGELNVYRVLGSPVFQAYNKSFSTLVLPTAIHIDEVNRTLTLPFYEGQTYNRSWDVTNGGASMSLELVEEISRVLHELAEIDPMPLAQHEGLAGVPNLTFNHHQALDYFYGLATKLQRPGNFTDRDLEDIRSLLSHEQTSRMIVNNGDFYPRNFIKRADGKIVLIDWETWNSHSPFFIVDHPENVAAVQFVHMWGNIDWQNTYKAELAKYFSFSEKDFAKGVITKALTLASFFPEHKELARGQLSIMRSVLDAA